MVDPSPLDYNILLGHDYFYDMGAIVLTLFRVMHFLHGGRIVTIYLLSFLDPNMAFSQPSWLNGSFVPMVSSLAQINYVANCSIPTPTDDQFRDVVHYVLGALEPYLFNGFISMYPFQSIVLPSDENLLEFMTSYG